MLPTVNLELATNCIQLHVRDRRCPAIQRSRYCNVVGLEDRDEHGLLEPAVDSRDLVTRMPHQKLIDYSGSPVQLPPGLSYNHHPLKMKLDCRSRSLPHTLPAAMDIKILLHQSHRSMQPWIVKNVTFRYLCNQSHRFDLAI